MNFIIALLAAILAFVLGTSIITAIMIGSAALLLSSLGTYGYCVLVESMSNWS
jgi:hypothetical protein